MSEGPHFYKKRGCVVVDTPLVATQMRYVWGQWRSPQPPGGNEYGLNFSLSSRARIALYVVPSSSAKQPQQRS